jgi:hypothetical protein
MDVAFSSEVDPGSREENASKQDLERRELRGICNGGGHVTQASHDPQRQRPVSQASQPGDWHDATGHHRYYGSSACNGGERLAETRRGPRPPSVNLFGF